MTGNDVMGHLKKVVGDMVAAKGHPAAVLSEDTELLGGRLPIDSLDLAEIVINLTEITGKDPFGDGFIEFRTLGELARLYAD